MSYDPYEIASKAQSIAANKRKLKLRRKRKKHKSIMDLAHGSITQKQGKLAETISCHYLIEQGLKILAQNLFCRAGEIDILAIDQGTIVFIEVRERKSNYYGNAASTINRDKQHKIIRAANYFLPRIYSYTGHKMPCRFDVIAIDNGQISWLKHAFTI